MTKDAQDKKTPSPPPNTSCPKCGSPLTATTFRTGSMEKPKEQVKVCQRCGTRV